MFDPKRPNNDLPPLPPKAELETKSVLKLCIEARRVLAAADVACLSLPDPSILINSIPMLEAQASSAIENFVTTTDELFKQAQLNDGNPDPATKETLSYRKALRMGFDSLASRPLSVNLATDICRTLTGINLDVRRTPGTTLRDVTSGNVIYTPPEGEPLLRELLGNWEKFVHDSGDLDPLVAMAVQHYQFQAIHPFPDGNGRTGRILNLLFLVERGLLRLPILFMSGEILAKRNEYYTTLRNVTEHDQWSAWIEFILRIVTQSASRTMVRIMHIGVLSSRTERLIRKDLPRIASHDLLQILFRQPYCRIRDLVDNGVAKRQTASAYLNALCDAGVLVEHKIGREKIYLNRRLLDVLTNDPPDCDTFDLGPGGRPVRLLEQMSKHQAADGSQRR